MPNHPGKQYPNKSSHAYIAARLREGDGTLEQIRTAIPDRCDHTSAICPTKECVEAWAIDWELFFSRTIAGRTQFVEFIH